MFNKYLFDIVHDWALQGFRVLCRVNLQEPGCSAWWHGGHVGPVIADVITSLIF